MGALQLLKDKSYFLKASKCEFKVQEMDLLGWRAGNGELRIDPSKIAGLKEWLLVLKNKLHVQKMMGVLNYLQSSIKGYGEIAKPINDSIKKENKPFIWMTECRNALKRLIDIATSEPVLKCPDLEKQFELVVDASQFAIGAVLCQKDEKGKMCHIRYFSKSLNKAERNYDMWD